MSDLHDNPIVEALASESDIPYVNRAVVFLYVFAVVRGSRSRGWLIATFAHNLLRAFGAVGLALPLLLGQMPSDILKGVDDYAQLVAGAMLLEHFLGMMTLPKPVDQILDHIVAVSYAIVKGNAAAMGYTALQGACPGSYLAPAAGAYIAVNGHRLIENGVSAFGDKLKKDGDAKLAVFSGLLYFLMTSGEVGPAIHVVLARALLVVYRISCDYVDYDDVLAKVEGIFDKATGGLTTGRKMRRGRSMSRR